MKAQFADKPNAAAYNDLGVWFAGQKQYACAADAFATSLQMDPGQKDLPHIAFMFGVALYFSGNQKDSIGALQEAEQLGYRDIKLHIILATALDAAHEIKEAENEWREALKFDPELSTALDALSNELLADADFKGIIATLEQPRLLGQRTPQQSLNLAAAYAGVGSEEKAAMVLEYGGCIEPYHWEGHKTKIIACTGWGRIQDKCRYKQDPTEDQISTVSHF